MQLFVLISYVLSAISWLGVFISFLQQFRLCKKRQIEIPNLLLPFMIASLAFCLDSFYFGVMRLDEYVLNTGIHDILNVPDLIAFPKAVVAFSGLFVWYKLNKNRGIK